MSEPTLLEVQRWIKSRIQAGAIPLPDDTRAPALNPQGGQAGVERLAVYAEGYLVRIEQALREMYPAVHHVLGARTFLTLSCAYVKRQASHDYNLSMAGRLLPEFLEHSTWLTSFPFLKDLAVLERLVSRAFHAHELPSLTQVASAGLTMDDWGWTRLVFQPSVAVVASAYPVLDIWTARNRPITSIDIDLVDRPQRVLVSRQGLQVRCEMIDEPQWVMLDGLLAGQSFATVAGVLAQRALDGHPPVAEWFARWAQAGLLVRCER